MATCGGAAAAPAPTNFVPDEIWHRAISLAPGELVHLHLRSGDDARKFQESCPLLQHAPLVTGKNFCDAQAVTITPPLHAPASDKGRNYRRWHVDEVQELTRIGREACSRSGKRRTKKTKKACRDTIVWRIAFLCAGTTSSCVQCSLMCELRATPSLVQEKCVEVIITGTHNASLPPSAFVPPAGEDRKPRRVVKNEIRGMVARGMDASDIQGNLDLGERKAVLLTNTGPRPGAPPSHHPHCLLSICYSLTCLSQLLTCCRCCSRQLSPRISAPPRRSG